MSAAKHTPGPWRLDLEDGRIYADRTQDRLICDVRGWGWLQQMRDGAAIQDANARLIAAAPELLERLRDANATVCANLCPASAGFGDPEHHAECIANRAAIALATGRDE